jgi:hypothetical protein
MTSIEHIKYLWWVMHHSDDPDRRGFAVSCYLDESGTHGGSPQSIVAGLVLNQSGFLTLDTLWENLLARHNIVYPLHMKEFGPDGKFGHISIGDRKLLFDQAAKIINYNKIHSIAFVVDQSKFNTIIDKRIRRHLGVYGACFMGCAHIAFLSAEHSQYKKDIAFVVESGNKHANHIRNAHKEMINIENNKAMNIHVGSLTFASKKISALQAADIIAWGVRRKVAGEHFPKGFEPIKDIFGHNHDQRTWKEEWLYSLNDAILNKSRNDSEY